MAGEERICPITNKVCLAGCKAENCEVARLTTIISEMAGIRIQNQTERFIELRDDLSEQQRSELTKQVASNVRKTLGDKK